MVKITLCSLIASLALGTMRAGAADSEKQAVAPALIPALTIPAAHRSEVLGLATFGDSGVLLSVGQSREVKFWDLETGKFIRELPMNAPGRALAFSPSGKLLAAGGGEFAQDAFHGGITIWNTETWQEVRRISFVSADVMSIAFLDEKVFVSAGLNGVRVWNVETGKLDKHIPTDTAVLAMDVSRNKSQIAIATFSTSCQILNTKDWSVAQTLRRLPGDKGMEPRAIVFTGGDQRILAGGSGLLGWELATGKRGGDIALKSEVLACARLGDRWVIAAGGKPNEEGRIWVCDAHQAAIHQALRAHGDRVRAIAVNERNTVVITGGADGSIRTWKVKR